MIWLFVAYRDRYVRMRTTLVAFTAACLLIQLIPVAPPRMLPLTGMVDTAAVYGQSVYSAHSGFDPDQLSAMPSVHVGWALLVAIAVNWVCWPRGVGIQVNCPEAPKFFCTSLEKTVRPSQYAAGSACSRPCAMHRQDGNGGVDAFARARGHV